MSNDVEHREAPSFHGDAHFADHPVDGSFIVVDDVLEANRAISVSHGPVATVSADASLTIRALSQ
jgi:hypothetical protein